MNNQPLKLFVWEDVLCDYSSGIMFALAHDVDEARKVIIEKNRSSSSVKIDLVADPVVITSPEGFAVWGGG